MCVEACDTSLNSCLGCGWSWDDPGLGPICHPVLTKFIEVDTKLFRLLLRLVEIGSLRGSWASLDLGRSLYDGLAGRSTLQGRAFANTTPYSSFWLGKRCKCLVDLTISLPSDRLVCILELISLRCCSVVVRKRCSCTDWLPIGKSSSKLGLVCCGSRGHISCSSTTTGTNPRFDHRTFHTIRLAHDRLLLLHV